MKVTAGNGRTWRVGRRRLPWVYRARRLVYLWDLTPFGTNSVLWPFDWLVSVLLMFVIPPWSIFYVLLWIVALLLVPFLELARAVGLAHTLVVAYPLGTHEIPPREWKARVDALAAAEILEKLPAELRAYGQPRTLSERV